MFVLSFLLYFIFGLGICLADVPGFDVPSLNKRVGEFRGGRGKE